MAATADKDGRWIVYLEPLAASATPAELVVTGNNTVRVADVLVGDVWLLSGQSNMEWPVERAANPKEETAEANFPLIRHLKLKRDSSATPQDNPKIDGGAWRVCTPETANWFSAVGFYFARAERRKALLRDFPTARARVVTKSSKSRAHITTV